MNTDHLQYIIEVSEQGTIAKAAENLHVSHSAISQAIASLESESGDNDFQSVAFRKPMYNGRKSSD